MTTLLHLTLALTLLTMYWKGRRENANARMHGK